MSTDVATDTGERFGFIAGDPALDFVNTVDWRLDEDRRTELLRDYGDLVTWAELAGVVSSAEAEQIRREATGDAVGAEAALTDAISLREALYETALGARDRVETIDDAYRTAQRCGHLTLENDIWVWRDVCVDLSTIRCRLARHVVPLLTSNAGRIGQCGDAACGWVFLDTSPRHNRHWCSQAMCGERNRSRRHYQKARAATVHAPRQDS
ncbi:CGNR zinc finger domain-containing protein [Acidipropionibacterium acidipropionici]|nr:CGNR zinc finger domain-containing protein [Acidipropionibacterium acidipropionici]